MVSNPVLDAALKRAAILAVLLGVSAFVGARQQGLDWEPAIYAGVGALVLTLITRGLGEGGYDSNRAANNQVNDGDVPVAASGVTVIESTTP